MGLGIGECCCDTVSPCPDGDCCTPTSISFYMQYNTVTSGICICTECDTGPFGVTLSSETCPTDGATEEAGSWVMHLDDEFCTGVTFESAALCDGISSIGPFAFDCINACYSASFSGPCWECSGEEGCAEEITHEQIDYVIRAVSGKTDTNQCVTVITIFRKVSSGGVGCTSMSPRYRDLNVYVFEHGADNEEDCCATYSWPGASSTCIDFCDAAPDLYLVQGCTAAPAIGTIPNPEWGEVVFSC